MVRSGSAVDAEPRVDTLPNEARAAVLAWFDASGRALAFRGTRDPYAILVSEIMAQQTQIGRVVEAWSRFLERFPTVADLAATTPADVLRAWQGLGYDRRALNLRRAAIAIVEQHGGQVPRDLAALQRLPGVGPYTARAVAAIAFDQPVGAVDTNVRRVLGRSLGGGSGADWPPERMQAIADQTVDRARPGAWTHALMDVGATFCRPRAPRCPACPLAGWCRFATEPSRAAPEDAVAPPSRAPAVRFEGTSRWLRGRIVDRLRAVEDAAWATFDAPIGEHSAAAVTGALRALARDGVVELDSTDRLRARLALD